MDDSVIQQETSQVTELTEIEKTLLKNQDSRIVSEVIAKRLEIDARKFWDIFYKRNGDRFFKDRHWTTREFVELIPPSLRKRTLLEVGCGVGNFVFPLLEKNPATFSIYACDFSPRAIDLVKSHKLFNETYIKAFVADITDENALQQIPEASIDIVTLIFVLSAIHPKHFDTVLGNLFTVLKPQAVVLFRDYGLYDMTQLRFKPGHKIVENLYMRQDGTRSGTIVNFLKFNFIVIYG